MVRSCFDWLACQSLQPTGCRLICGIHATESQDLGIGLKAVWYGAEQFGNIVGLRNKRPRTTAQRTPTEVHISVVLPHSLCFCVLANLNNVVWRSKDDKTADIGQYQARL